MEWIKASGGPLALVVLGLGLAGITTIAGGLAIVGVGLIWWLATKPWKRLPWEIRRKHQPLSREIPRAPTAHAGTPSWEELNQARIQRYQDNLGLFLIHTWRPSDLEGQVADVEIRLWEHPDDALTAGEVSAVEYVFGPKFSDHTRVITNPENNFAITESMWGPMLCLAKVYLASGRQPLLLERYINFEDEEIELAIAEQRIEATSVERPILGGDDPAVIPDVRYQACLSVYNARDSGALARGIVPQVEIFEPGGQRLFNHVGWDVASARDFPPTREEHTLYVAEKFEKDEDCYAVQGAPSPVMPNGPRLEGESFEVRITLRGENLRAPIAASFVLTNQGELGALRLLEPE